MADALVTTDDINAGGGYRQTLDGWYSENVAGTGGPTELSRLATTSEAANRWIAPRPGSITGVAVKSNANRTAGTCTVIVNVNGVPIALQAVLDGTNVAFKATAAPKDTYAFAAGDEISPYYTTSGWTPTTADIRASVEIET